MKTQIVSKLPIVFSLILGIFVCWVAYTPVAEGADLIYGGSWGPIPFGTCCDGGDTTVSCSSNGYCTYGSTSICHVNYSAGGGCWPLYPYTTPCSGPTWCTQIALVACTY